MTISNIDEYFSKNLVDIDPVPFGANRAIMTYYSDVEAGDDYVLLYDDKIVVLNLEEPITDEQIEIICDRLI